MNGSGIASTRTDTCTYFLIHNLSIIIIIITISMMRNSAMAPIIAPVVIMRSTCKINILRFHKYTLNTFITFCLNIATIYHCKK